MQPGTDKISPRRSARVDINAGFMSITDEGRIAPFAHVVGIDHGSLWAVYSGGVSQARQMSVHRFHRHC